MRLGLVSQSTEPIGGLPRDHGESVAFREEQLVKEAQRGSHDAFRQLVECYETRIFRLAKRIAQSSEDAEEIMQDAFVQAYNNLVSGETPGFILGSFASPLTRV